MGTLLDFSSAPKPAVRVNGRRNRPPNAGQKGYGEVILFPGVRYEREELDLASRIGTIGKSAGSAAPEKD